MDLSSVLREVSSLCTEIHLRKKEKKAMLEDPQRAKKKKAHSDKE